VTATVPSTGQAAPKRSVADLQAEVDAARMNMVASVEQIKAQLTPQALVQRGLRGAAGWFVGPSGVRPERVAIAGAVAVGIVLVVALGSRRRK
jgi:hypothetical protein